MLRFAKESGTEFPETLHLANFMGHHEKIHKEVYRKPVIVKDITEVSQLLEAAQGVRDKANNLIDESDSDEDESNINTEITENNEIFNKISYLQQSSDSSFSSPMYKKRTKNEVKAVQKKRRSGGKDLIYSVHSINKCICNAC
ncbi:uncharacterized protein LOC112638362 [Camponotus floridanus]|uniref:uncharacterized protein LOC112638362 n=1 Tax=Camponotus floridanus TaxID=104421 RepID=UPI000DC66B48|nr:uncharacterized protein LOC112638362 [Camponotus floridanus]